MLPRTKVTSFDVAKLAGVSQPTVSRALRNLPGTSPETRARVVAAAEQLNYLRSDRARALSTRSTHRIAVVSEELTNPFYPELVAPLRHNLAAEGFRTVLVTDHDLSGQGADVLADGSYDGVILTTTHRASTLPRDLTERGVPHVLANRILDVAESPSSAFDNRAGARAIAELLASSGHRTIAYIGGPVTTSTGRERLDGFKVGLRERGLTLRRRQTASGPFTHQTGYDSALSLLDQTVDRPTAIACGNDVIAAGAMSAARKLHLAVPDDVSVVGFDDITLAAWPLLELTTVHCSLADLAMEAVGQLLGLLRDEAVLPTVKRLPTRVVLRGTHGPP